MKKLRSLGTLFGLLVFVCVAVGQQGPAPLPATLPAPPDPLPSQTAAGAVLIESWTWVKARLGDLWAAQVSTQAEVVALRAQLPALVAADSYMAASGAAPLKELGVCAPQANLSASAPGQTFDYAVNVPAAGNYRLIGCVASASNVPWSFRFEYPAGTSLGSLGPSSIPSPLNNWSAFRQVPSQVVTLPAGQVTIRVVAETVNFNWGGFLLARQ